MNASTCVIGVCNLLTILILTAFSGEAYSPLTMKRFASIISALLLVATASLALGQQTVQQPVLGPTITTIAVFPLEDIRAGMKGTARTVFSGSDTQEFNVEILGVLPGFPGPRQSAIIGKLSGSNVEKTGVFAGMSGSPVYIDGKIVGAIAFSFPFSKEPIAGITPIKQMIDIFNQGAQNDKGKPKEPRPVSFAQLAGTDWKPNLPKPAVSSVSLLAPVSAGSPLLPLIGQQMTPIATPLVFSGISQESLSMFAPQLVANGLLPVSGVGGSAAITPMAEVNGNTFPPGSSISVQLVRGDYSLAAAGTVTMRDGDRIYAFGHPFLSLGASDMPMSESSVVTVIANMNNSFKLAVPGQMVGSIAQDRASGIYGLLKRAPKMIPVKVNLHTSRDRTETYSYEVVSDSFLTPSLPPSMVATLNSDRTSGGYTPTVLSPVYEMELAPAEFVISGQQLIAIDVVR